MIEFDGITYNKKVSKLIRTALAVHNSEYEELTDELVPSRVGRMVFMAAVADCSHLSFIPRIAEFCDRALLEKCSASMMTRGRFVPIMQNNNKLIVGIANPWNTTYEGYLNQLFPNVELEPIVTVAPEIGKAIESGLTSNEISETDLADIEVEEAEEIQDFDITKEYEEPIVQLIASIMAKAVQQRASDIHLKVEKDIFYYSFRIDGDIGKKTEIPMKLKDRLDAYLLNLMKLPTEIRNTTPGISGRFTISYFKRSIDVRYERHRTYRGYHITIRLLDKGNMEVALGKGSLAFDEETLFELQRVMKVPAGIIVMSGPTGSGKSTTLNAILRELNRPEVNILTLENPVEDEIPGVTHCDLKSAKEFKPMISSFMRSDPDIILMGEVRDYDSAEIAIEAAVTGHKVLTTIHTQRASQIIERFEQLGMERWKIAQTLKAACAQRLAKILCQHCKVDVHGISEHHRKLYNLGEEWSERDICEASPSGCPECRFSGYAGRSAILEIIPINPKLSDQLSKGEISPYDLEQIVLEEGHLPSLRRSGLRLLSEGKTDLRSLSKVIDMTYAS